MLKIKFVTFNIRHGKGIDGSVSLARVIQTLKAMAPDVVCLQEVDRFMPRSFLQDQPRWLSIATGMKFAFAPNLRFNKMAVFGNAILSRFPISLHVNTLLPGKGEQRGLQHCILTLSGGTRVSLFNTHLGLCQEERSAQVRKIVDQISQTNLPFLLAGDFNSVPKARELHPLDSLASFVCKHPINTFPASDPRHPVDHIYTSNHWNVTGVSAFQSEASDHLPLVCLLEI